MAARSIVVLRLSKRIKNILAFAQHVATSMNGNSSFPSPTPPLATVLADVAALYAAETAVLSRAQGTTAARDARLSIVRSDLASLRSYVQSVAASAAPEEASVIVASAGFSLRRPTSLHKAALAAKQGTTSGTVLLTAKAVARTASYEWAYSTDQETWTAVPETFQSKTVVTGLTVGTLYFFRFEARTRSGAEIVSPTVALVVG